jgi:hypothetical protein
MVAVPPAVWADTLEHLRRCGDDRRECVTYWTGPADVPAVVDAAIHPAHTANPGGYEIDGHWLHEFWVDLGRSRRSVRVQVHTHAFDAFHSRTDDLWPVVHTPGFLSLVIPHFAGAFSRGQLYLSEIDETGRWTQVDLDARLVGIP